MAGRRRRSIARRTCQNKGMGLTDYLPKRPPSNFCFIRGVEDQVDDDEDYEGDDEDEEDHLRGNEMWTTPLSTKSIFHEFDFESEPLPSLATVAEARDISAESLTKAFNDFRPFQAPEVEDEGAGTTHKPDDDEEYPDQFFNSATTFPDAGSETELNRANEALERIVLETTDMPPARAACATSSFPIQLDTVAKLFDLPLITDATRPLFWSSYLANLPPSNNLFERPLWTLMNRSRPANPVHRTAVCTVVGDWRT